MAALSDDRLELSFAAIERAQDIRAKASDDMVERNLVQLGLGQTVLAGQQLDAAALEAFPT